eukprot:10122511-Ditylum_brightwellii.AAC.1
MAGGQNFGSQYNNDTNHRAVPLEITYGLDKWCALYGITHTSNGRLRMASYMVKLANIMLQNKIYWYVLEQHTPTNLSSSHTTNYPSAGPLMIVNISP